MTKPCKRPYIGISESQSAANAEALARRGSPYTMAHETSVRLAWGPNRDPDTLREAVRRVRRLYADEVPYDLHERGEDGIGEGGTPKWTARASGYIFGSAQGSDISDPDQLISYYHSPFRANLATMLGQQKGPNGTIEAPEHDRHPKGDVCRHPIHKRGLIVSHVTIGSMGAQEAAIKEGVPVWCAKTVAFDALRAFLRSVSDVRVHAPSEGTAA